MKIIFSFPDLTSFNLCACLPSQLRYFKCKMHSIFQKVIKQDYPYIYIEQIRIENV